AYNAYRQVVRLRGQSLQLLRGQHAVEGLHQGGQSDRQIHVVQQPAQVLQRVGDTLQEMRFAFVEAAKTIRAQCLQNSHINVRVVILQKGFTIDFDKRPKLLDIEVERLLPQCWRQIGLGVVEKRSDV